MRVIIRRIIPVVITYTSYTQYSCSIGGQYEIANGNIPAKVEELVHKITNGCCWLIYILLLQFFTQSFPPCFIFCYGSKISNLRPGNSTEIAIAHLRPIFTRLALSLIKRRRANSPVAMQIATIPFIEQFSENMQWHL